MAALIDSHFLVNSDSQHKLGETTDRCTGGTREQARKLTAVMRESQEQQKRDNENSAVKPEKAPAQKHWKEDKEIDHISFLKAATKKQGKAIQEKASELEKGKI